MEAGMNDLQIEEVVRVLRTTLRRHRKEFVPGAAQRALAAREFKQELLAPFRRYCGTSNTIIRRVKVNRSRSLQEVLVAVTKGRVQILNHKVVAEIPKFKEYGEFDIIFFDGIPNGSYLADEYARRNLKPAHPMLVLAANEADETFADDHPNTVLWKTRTGCGGIFFGVGLNGRFVGIGDFGDYVRHNYWYAGVQKIEQD